jgi:Ice-binding-like
MTLRAGTLVLLSLALSAYAYSGTDPSAPNTPIHLGTADKFAVLAGSGITNVDANTYIIGDVGSSPTPKVTGLTKSQVRGHLYLTSNGVTANAQRGLTVAYGEAKAAPCGHDLTGQDLGGMRLGPGVYCFSSSAQLTGTLTLDAHGDPNAQWIFQTGSTLTTASHSKVVIILGKNSKKGQRGCNVYWKIGSSATVGTGSTFVGIIMALHSITLDGGVLRGKALARNGAVTMSGQETVNGSTCNRLFCQD